MARFTTFFTIGLLLFALTACESNNGVPDDATFPQTPEEIAASVEMARAIASVSGVRIENDIRYAVANDEKFDPSALVQEILDLDGVEDARLNETGSVVTVRQSDGAFHNVLLVDFTDDRWFSGVDVGTVEHGLFFSDDSEALDIIPTEFPPGRRAGVFAAFQGGGISRIDIKPIVGLFEAARFVVDTFIGEEVDLDKFRGAFLEQYDVIYIVTHGAVGATQGGEETTLIMTREVVTAERTASLTTEESKAVGMASHGGTAYYALTPQWLKTTSGGGFERSWVFVNACEGAQIDEGDASLSASLLELGAGGFSGYDDLIEIYFSGEVSKALISRMTSGEPLAEASIAVRTDRGLSRKFWASRLLRPVIYSLSQLNDSQRISEPFYLLDPDEIVGIASMTPDRGVPGTLITYEVTLNARFSNRTTSVYVDIDNTGQRFQLTERNESLWEIQLIVPTASRYPRVDTFTFTAADSSGGAVGRGTATFTIEDPALSEVNGRITASNPLMVHSGAAWSKGP